MTGLATARALSPERQAIERAIHDPALWLSEWKVALGRPKLPVSWPALAGAAPAGSVCGGCGGRGWWCRAGRRQEAYWVCETCHPPTPARVAPRLARPLVAA